MKMMTDREVFDKVAEHLIRQGVQAEDTNSWGCRYMTRDGKMCAVGCLIQDVYTPGCEGASIAGLCYSDDIFFRAPYAPSGPAARTLATALNDSGVPVSSGPMLDALQRLHDRSLPELWPEGLATIENTYFGAK